MIGLLVSYNDKNIYIPTIYSGLLIDKKFLYIAEYNDYLSYSETKSILNEIYENSNGNIPCKPLKKIVDNNMIVGIITETNQFVPVIPEVYEEEEEEMQDLELVFNKGTNNLLLTDNKLMTTNEVDDQRILLIKKIDLENNFYNLFRNTFKVVINYDVNNVLKNNIVNSVKNITVTYKNKMIYLKSQIKNLLKGVIKFSEMPDMDTIEDVNDLTICLGFKKNDCKKKQYCFVKKNTYGSCGLILPKTNLYNGSNNKEFYYEKLADQIIRYEKIRKYIFTPRAFLSFQRINYKINEDEIVVLEEILLEQYLKDIKLSTKNKYIRSKELYELVDSKKIISSKYIDNCLVTSELGKNLKISNQIKKVLNTSSETKNEDGKNNLSLTEYIDTSTCGFKFIEYLINNTLVEKVNNIQIKQVLVDFYKNSNYPSTYSIWRGSDDNNWHFFSLVQWYSFQTKIKKKFILNL